MRRQRNEERYIKPDRFLVCACVCVFVCVQCAVISLGLGAYTFRKMAMPVSQEVAKMFEAIDTNFNGYITRDELEEYAKKTGQPESMVDVNPFPLSSLFFSYIF